MLITEVSSSPLNTDMSHGLTDAADSEPLGVATADKPKAIIPKSSSADIPAAAAASSSLKTSGFSKVWTVWYEYGLVFIENILVCDVLIADTLAHLLNFYNDELYKFSLTYLHKQLHSARRHQLDVLCCQFNTLSPASILYCWTNCLERAFSWRGWRHFPVNTEHCFLDTGQ